MPSSFSDSDLTAVYIPPFLCHQFPNRAVTLLLLPSTQTRWHANAWWKCKVNCIWNRIIKHWNCCRQPLVVKRNTCELYCMCSCAGIGLHESVVKRWPFISTHTNTTIPRGFALPHSTTQLDRVKMKPAATFPETKATFSRAMRWLWTN